MATGNQVLPEAPVAHDRPQPRSRRGGGGRWLVWGLRGVVWVVLLLVGYRGVAAIVTGSPESGPAAEPASAAGGFPVGLAQAYALEFGQIYLNFSPATAVARGTELADFLPPGADAQLGWNGAGTQTMQSEQVAGVAVQNAHNAIVTLLASVDGHLISLGVPIYAADGGLVVSGRPALLSPPPRATPPALPPITADLATQAALSRQLPAFFRAFASGDGLTLGRFLVAGAQISGLDGAVTFGSISSITVPDSPGATRHIVVTVVWSTPSQTATSGKSSVGTTPAQIQMTYAMTVVRISGSWYVQAIGAAATQPGSTS
jgi:hypothetical protein